MEDKFIFYDVDGERFKIRESEMSEFEKDFPTARINMSVDGENFNIGVNERDEFLKDFEGSAVSYTNFDEQKPQNPQTSFVAAMPEAENNEDDKTTIWESAAKGLGSSLAGYGLDALNILSANNKYVDPNATNPYRLMQIIKTGKGPEMIETPDYDTLMRQQNDPAIKESVDMINLSEQWGREADPTGGKEGFVDLIFKGKIGKALQKGVAVTTQSLPTTVAARHPMSLVVNMINMAGRNYAKETLENPDMPKWKRGIWSVGSAAWEQVVEKYVDPFEGGGGAVKEVSEEFAKELLEKGVKEAVENIAKKITKRLVKNTAKKSAGEGIEEVVTSVGQDIIGEGLDLIDGDTDYGIRAQWEDYKEENKDAKVGDFALNKAKEYFDSFIGGALSGSYMSGPTQIIYEGSVAIDDYKASKAFQDARDLGSSMDYGNIYDTNDDVARATEAVASAMPKVSRGFIDNLTAEQAYTLSRNQNIPAEHRKALTILANEKAKQEGLNQKLNERLDGLINANRILIDAVAENDNIVEATHNGKTVYVKGAKVNANGTVSLPNGENGPVIIVDARTGAQQTVNTNDIASAVSRNALDYGNEVAKGLMSMDEQLRETARNTMSPRAKMREVSQFAGKKMNIDLGNGIIEVEVQQILPLSGEVQIKGKKGDLNGQSIARIGIDAFYNSITRDDNGNPMFVEGGPIVEEKHGETPTPAPAGELTGEEDFREYAGPIIINGVPVNVEVQSQDDATDSIVYTYTDENGRTQRGTATVKGFAEAVQQAMNVQPEPAPQPAPAPINEPINEPNPTPAPIEDVPVTPQTIDWDVLFEQSPEDYFAEMQKQFGEKTEKRLNAVIAATQKKLDALNKANPQTDNEIFENEEKKEKLEAKIATLNEMVARLNAPVAEVTVAPEAPEVPETPATEEPVGETPPAEPAIPETPVAEGPVEQTPEPTPEPKPQPTPAPEPMPVEQKPVAPNPVADPVKEAQKKEAELLRQLGRAGLSNATKQDLARRAGKAIADMFATREEYEAYEETANDLGEYLAFFEGGVEESFAKRSNIESDSPVNDVPLTNEPKGENNGDTGKTEEGRPLDNRGGRTSNEGNQEGDSTDAKGKSERGNKGKGGKAGKQVDKYPARKGNATQKLLIDTFGFNSVTIPNTRKSTLNAIYDFMMEMSKMLGISPKSIGQGGWLSVSNLRSNAHFAAVHEMRSGKYTGEIKDVSLKFKYSALTGIAHEWFHALDYALEYFDTGIRQTTASEIDRRKFSGRKEVWDAINGIVNAINKSGHPDRIKKLVRNISAWSYWLSPKEMCARAFDQYILDKFKAAGIEIEGVYDEKNNGNPTPEEMAVIAPAIDNLFKVLHEKEGKTPGTSVLYQIGEIMEEDSDAKRLATKAVLESLADTGIEVVEATDEQAQQALTESDIMLHMREEGESAISFAQRAVDDYRKRYTEVAPISVVDINNRQSIADIYGVSESELPQAIYDGFKREYESGSLGFYMTGNYKYVAIFAREEVIDGKHFEDTLIHENIHALLDKKGKYPVRLGEWLYNNADNPRRHRIKDFVDRRYKNNKHEEMLTNWLTPYMVLGRSEKAIDLVPVGYKPYIQYIYNELGYDSGKEDIRRTADSGLSGLESGESSQIISVERENDGDSREGVSDRKGSSEVVHPQNGKEFFKTPNGTVYGWTDGKKIYLTKAGINPNTPVHEYTHLWAKAMMQKNPKGWQSIKDNLRGTPVWNEVLNDPNYSNIRNNEDLVASEVLSRLSGRDGAAKLERMAQQMIDEAKGTARKLEARGLVQRIKDALNEFWSWVGIELFGIEKFESVEQITDRVLWDLMNKTDLGELSEGQVETQIVTDPKVIAELEASPKRTGFRNVVQNEDGTFSSPMAYWLQSTKEGAKSRVETAKFELGKWEEAEEHPELVDDKGKVTLVKPNKSTVANVAYDPYIHNRLEPVNLQFKDAWKRDDLVYVQTEVAENDLNDGYHADKALLPVGVHSWSNGDVMLSRYDKPVRIMPWNEVADAWVERLNGEGVNFDVVPPALRNLLAERGVEILPPHKGMGKDCNDAYKKWKSEQTNSNRLSRRDENNAKFVEQFEQKQNNEKQELEYSDEFRRLQEESARLSERMVSDKEGVQRATLRGLVGRIGGTLQRELDRATRGRGYKFRTLVNESKGTSFDIIENIDGRLFHDIFSIVRTYLPNGELVDLHDNYDDAICYITSDGLAGFAVTADGNLISVFSLYGASKKGFLGAIKDLITEAGATHLDGYNSPLQPLAEIYSKVFGWKVASMMDYNMEYDHDNIAENHKMPQVAFMVNTDADIETRHFNKDQYDGAVGYQLQMVSEYGKKFVTLQNNENTGNTYTDNDRRGVESETEGAQGEVPVSGPLSEGRKLARPENGEVSKDGNSVFNPISQRNGESDIQRNNREAKFLSFVNNLSLNEQTLLYSFLKDYRNSPSGVLRGRANDFIDSIRQNGNSTLADFVDDFINDELKYREGISSAEVNKHGLLVAISYHVGVIEQMFNAFNRDKYNGILFDRAIKLAKRFGVSVKFTTRNPDGSFFTSFGNYASTDNVITIDANLLVDGNTKELCQTLVHELIHSVVARATSIMSGRVVDKNNQFIDPKSLPKDVIDGINTLKEVHEAIKDDWSFQDTYGKTDFEEMLSEISDPKFRTILKAKNLWKKFLNGICKILGIKDSSAVETDALTEIEQALDKILSSAERGELDSAYASFLGRLADGYTLDDLQRLGDGQVKTMLTRNALFRTGIDPTEVSRETARATYERVVQDQWQEFQRQFQDAMQPMRIAIEAIQQETGNMPVEDYENFLLIQNQASSRSRVEIDDFARRYYSPIVEAVNSIIDQMLDARGLNKKDKKNRAEAYAEIRQYMIAKHGLERNHYYQANKTRKLRYDEKKREYKIAQDEYDAKVDTINNDATLTDAERELQLREAKDEYDAARLEIDTREVPDMRDYSGLTALFGFEPKQYKKAEEEAQILIDNFEAQIGESADRLWEKINKATDKTLRHSYESGLLSRQQYNDIKAMFKFYIPLRGFDETTAEDVYSYARFEGNRFNPAVQTAKGRTSLADDPLAIIMNMAESEIAQGNKNRAKQALYNFILNRTITDENGNQRQNSLMQVESVWYEAIEDGDGNVTYVIATPDRSRGETYEEFEERMNALAEEDKAYKSKKGKVDVGMRFQKPTNANTHYIYLKVNGVEKAIYINGDPKAAEAINGANRKELGGFATKMRDINRVLSSTFTNYSLEFTARNYFRDMIYSHINIDVKEADPAYRKKFRQNWRHNNLGTMLKLLKAYRAGELEGRALTEDEAAFVEFMKNGGQTGYTLINSVENHKKDLERAIKNMQKGIEHGGVKDSAVFKATLGGIELLNEASELVTRFAAFKTSRDMGRSVVRSISDAKEITVNFNTRGAQDGKGWFGMAAQYLGWSKFFFNASVQGVQNIKAMRDANKLKFATAVGGAMAFGFCTPMLVAAISALLNGDDDDEESYWNIPEYDRQNNFCIPVGGGRYAKIPLPIGFREVYAMGDMLAAMMWDKKFTRDTMQVGMDMANKIASVILPINPLESSANGLNFWHTFLYTALPSSAQFAVQNATNVDWKGAPLQKEYTYNENDPQWMKAYASNPDWMVGLSKWCNEHLGAKDMKGVDWSPEKLDNTLSNLFGGIYTLVKKTGKSFSMIWNEENRNLSNIPLAGVALGSGMDKDDRFVTDAYYDEKEYYDDRIGFINRRAKKFGLSLEDVFLHEKGKHHPKMMEIYNNREFDFMQEWYKGNKRLEKLEREIEKFEKEMAKHENPSQGMLNRLAEMEGRLAVEKREFVEDMLELD